MTEACCEALVHLRWDARGMSDERLRRRLINDGMLMSYASDGDEREF